MDFILKHIWTIIAALATLPFFGFCTLFYPLESGLSGVLMAGLFYGGAWVMTALVVWPVLMIGDLFRFDS